jgi:hypothetical protein
LGSCLYLIWGSDRNLKGCRCAVATREKTTFLCPRTYALFTLHTLLNAVICCSQLNTRGVLGLIPREWIISHRCSWMAVYVSCCNAQSKSHSDPLDISCYLYSINCPTVICLPSMCYLSYGETPLVNCGPRSYFLYIGITCLLYLHCLLHSHTIIAFHSIRSFLCLQQISEIDNLIISWEQNIWLYCVQVPRCSWQSKALDEVPYKLSGAVVKLASITFLSLAFSWIRLNLGFLLRENLLLCSSYLPLGVPNWMVKLHQHRATSDIRISSTHDSL